MNKQITPELEKEFDELLNSYADCTRFSSTDKEYEDDKLPLKKWIVEILNGREELVIREIEREVAKMKESKPEVIPMDNYVNRIERNAGHNDALDQVMSKLRLIRS